MNCPSCNGQMVPMQVSWFCPKDCDRQETVTCLHRGKTWTGARFSKGQQIPSEATRGWWTSNPKPLDAVVQLCLSLTTDPDGPGWAGRDLQSALDRPENTSMLLVFWETK